MPVRNIILVALIVSVLWGCNKDEDSPPYTNTELVADNVLAATYFHTIFREAENAWAVMDANHYKDTTFKSVSMSDKKTIVCSDAAPFELTVTYNNWLSGQERLAGVIQVGIPDKVYRFQGQAATITLTGFSINQQSVKGSMNIVYGAPGEQDIYSYKLTSGNIYSLYDSQEVIVNSSVTDGNYTRVLGGGTTDQADDDWQFTGTYTNKLKEQTYTVKTVLPLDFLFNCDNALNGASSITKSEDLSPYIGYKYPETCGGEIEVVVYQDEY